MKTQDSNSNGNTVTKSIRKESAGWGRTVWFGSVNVTTVRRYYYSTKAAAMLGDISDSVGKCGRVA